MAETEKKSFVMYDSWATLLCNLPENEAGKLIQAICRYRFGEEALIDDPVVFAVFQMIKETLDADAKKYAETCERRKVSGSKGGEANATKSKQKEASANEYEYDSEYESDNDSVSDTPNGVDKDIYTGSVSAQKPEKKSEPKHRYGEYRHVMLTDKELERLKTDYGEQNALEAIQYLDEYIEMKGYKAKSHYLAMRKWVFSALDEEQQRRRRAGPGTIQNSSGRSAPKNREYDYDELERELLAKGLDTG